MKPTFEKTAAALILVCFLSVIPGTAGMVFAQEKTPEAVKIDAPDGLSTRILQKPGETGEILGIALQGDVLEVTGKSGDYYEVRYGESGKTGYVLEAHTLPWELPKQESGKALYVVLVVIVVAAVGVGGFFLFRAKRSRDVETHAASVAAAVRDAEDYFRAGEFADAAAQFEKFLSLQGGDVRNPDVYRRLAACYQKIEHYHEAARCWEKMRALGGLKTMEDYSLGVELMRALGRENEAAEIFENLLETETDEERIYEIRKKLYETYRRNKQPERLIKHAIDLASGATPEPGVVPETVALLISEGKTDLALKQNFKPIILGICQEFLEEKNISAPAERIYLKALEYDRTNKQLHSMLARKYQDSGEYRKAVSELTILHTIDKDSDADYVEQAARLYVEHGKVSEAIAEGNPLIVKKIAQLYLARSEVNPDAVAIYEKVLEFQPKAVGVNKMLSTVYLTRGDLQKYMEKLRLLHEIDGRNHDYLAELARCIVDNKLVDQTIREGNRDLNAKILKELLKRKAHDDDAVILFEKLARREPDNVLLRKALAHAYNRRGEPQKELEHLLAMASSRPDEPGVAENAASLAVKQGLLQMIAERGPARVLAATALEIARNRATGPFCEQILKAALKATPNLPGVQEYLRALPAAQAGPPAQTSAPQPPPARPPEPAKRERRPGTTTGKITRRIPTPPPQKEPPEVVITEGPDVGADTTTVTQRKPRQAPAPQEPPAPRPKPPQPQRPAAPQPKPPAPQEPPVPKPTPPAAAEEQFIDVTEAPVTTSLKSHPATTFVSAHSTEYLEQLSDQGALFRPEAGGLAYKLVQMRTDDGWGTWHNGVEINTNTPVLLRVFKDRLLERDMMKKFMAEISTLGFNMTHQNILAPEEVVAGPGALSGLVHPPLPLTLADLFKSDRKPGLDRLMELAKNIVDALAYSHNYKGADGKIRRTFHLHLQPMQVFLSEDLTTCKVAGLGYTQIYRNLTLARQARWQDPGMHPAYMPPEFFLTTRGSTFERAADVYALGVMIYELVTGEPPFEGPSFEDYKFQHTKVFPAPPRLTNPEVPDWMDPMILSCLEKDPQKRMKSIAEFQHAFRGEF